MSHTDREVRTVPAAKVSEWLVWFGQRNSEDPRNTENRRLSNRLYDVCQRAGAPDSTLAARGTSAATAGGATALPGFDWTSGEIAFTPGPGYGAKTMERLIAQVVAVTRISE